jgi:hypothetical protein
MKENNSTDASATIFLIIFPKHWKRSIKNCGCENACARSYDGRMSASVMLPGKVAATSRP